MFALDWSDRVLSALLQLLVCADVWIARLGLHLADQGALARRTTSLDVPGVRSAFGISY